MKHLTERSLQNWSLSNHNLLLKLNTIKDYLAHSHELVITTNSKLLVSQLLYFSVHDWLIRKQWNLDYQW